MIYEKSSLSTFTDLLQNYRDLVFFWCPYTNLSTLTSWEIFIFINPLETESNLDVMSTKEVVQQRIPLFLWRVDFENWETSTQRSKIFYQFQRDANVYVASMFTRYGTWFHIPYVDYDQTGNFFLNREQRMTVIDAKYFDTSKVVKDIRGEIKQLWSRDVLWWATLFTTRWKLKKTIRSILDEQQFIDIENNVRHKDPVFDAQSYSKMIDSENISWFEFVSSRLWADYLLSLYNLVWDNRMTYFKQNNETNCLELSSEGKIKLLSACRTIIWFMDSRKPVFNIEKVFTPKTLEFMKSENYKNITNEDVVRILHELYRKNKILSKHSRWELKKNSWAFLNLLASFLYNDNKIDEEELKEYFDYLTWWIKNHKWLQDLENELWITINIETRLKDSISMWLKVLWSSDYTDFSDHIWIRISYYPQPKLIDWKPSEKELRTISRIHAIIWECLSSAYSQAWLPFSRPSQDAKDPWFEVSAIWIYNSPNEKDKKLMDSILKDSSVGANISWKKWYRSKRKKWHNKLYSAYKNKSVFVSPKWYSYWVEVEIVPRINQNNRWKANPELCLVQKIMSFLNRTRVVCTLEEIELLYRIALRKIYEKNRNLETEQLIDLHSYPELADKLYSQNIENLYFSNWLWDNYHVKSLLKWTKESYHKLREVVVNFLNDDLRDKNPKFYPFLYEKDLQNDEKLYQRLDSISKNPHAFQKFNIFLDGESKLVPSIQNVYFTSNNTVNSFLTWNVPCNAYNFTPVAWSNSYYHVKKVYDEAFEMKKEKINVEKLYEIDTVLTFKRLIKTTNEEIIQNLVKDNLTDM